MDDLARMAPGLFFGLLALVALTVFWLARVLRAQSSAKACLTELAGAVGLLVDGQANQTEQLARALQRSAGEQMEAVNRATLQALALLGSQQNERLALFAKELTQLRGDTDAAARAARQEMAQALDRVALQLRQTQEQGMGQQTAALTQLQRGLEALTKNTEHRLDALKLAVEQRLDVLRRENEAKLEQMRHTVDEKLQGTLEQRLGASFGLVNQNLERVFKSVGEMQTIATGVGDLKRVLLNVKSRGTWGEATLGALLEQTLTAEQMAKNVEVVPGSGLRVEFAIRLPQDGSAPLWLPLDAKMPTEDYERLVEAADRGDAALVEEASRALERAVRLAAKDIAQKYVQPPHTTDFGVMFLPTEGLFAEVVRRPGLVDALQRDHRVVVTGPTTLGALLTSLRMGFRTLAIQQRSSEVWEVLGAVKAEFGRFGGVLDKVSKKLDEASNVVRDAGTRRRAVDRRLRSVEALTPEAAARALAVPAALGLDDGTPGPVGHGAARAPGPDGEAAADI